MADKTFTFNALRVTQGDGSPPLVLLSASAVRVEAFAGIPQKRRVQDGETVGFQRDLDEGRVRQLAKFYADPGNVIANPLLCAIRRPAGVDVRFVPFARGDEDAGGDGGAPDSEASVAGELTIRCPDFAAATLPELFKQARAALESRVPELVGRADPVALVQSLRPSIAEAELLDAEEDGGTDDQINDEGADEDEAQDSDAIGSGGEEALFEESHVSEFWDALRARELLLEKLAARDTLSTFLGFGRGALEAYLRPIVLVDGQHRLLGAMAAARQAEAAAPEDLGALTDAIRAGRDIGTLAEERLIGLARRLPLSLLMDSRAQEHVFQFVIVNQKATPVRPALLETIISSSLSEAEVAPIADRLENAGVPLKTARSMTYLVRNERSPFHDRVARGMAEEGAELLPWTVLGQLVSLFQNLKGARFFHDRKSDYADIWRRQRLEQSDIVKGMISSEITAFDAWRTPDGPWREVFIAFWSAVRDTLGNTENREAPNFWGRPRSSNLFNKPSLLTLATDFFAFLVETRRPLDDVSAVPSIVAEWLQEVDRQYFARDWQLKDVKKDAVGTRKQWASLWQRYRIDPRALPNVKSYSLSYKER